MPQNVNLLTNGGAPRPVVGRVQVTPYRRDQLLPARPPRERLFAGWRIQVRRQCRILAALLLVSAIVGWTGPGAWRSLARAASAFSPTPEYTLAALLGNLQRDPHGWLGQVVRVRAIVTGTPHWVSAPGSLTRVADMTQLRLVDVGGMGAVVSVPLLLSQADPLVAALRQLPLAGPALPSVQQPRWGESAVYRIQLRRIAHPARGAYYDAVLVDAAPGATLASCWALIDSPNCAQNHPWASW